MFFQREPEQEVTHADWAELVRLQQLNMLSIAHLTLRIAVNPLLVTDDVREELENMVRELEDRLAVFEEHFA